MKLIRMRNMKSKFIHFKNLILFNFQNATDISNSNDEKDIDEEDENESEDEDEKFVVPDGYLSQEEKMDEDGGFK